MAREESLVVGRRSAVAVVAMTRLNWARAGTGGDDGAPGTEGGLDRSDVA